MKYSLIYLLLPLLIISCDSDNGNNNTELPKPSKPIGIILEKEKNDSKNSQTKTGCEEAILPGC